VATAPAEQRPGQVAARALINTRPSPDTKIPDPPLRPGPHRARPRLPGCYGVIAMAVGLAPTLIALPALLVAVLIGITVPEPLMTM
jgi:hypothetical protein